MTNIWSRYRDKIAGGWRCISYEMFDKDSPDQKLIAKPHGDNPLGRVLISQNGFLSAHLARPDRQGPLPSGNAWQTGEDKEVAHVARGLSMYCGYLELFEDGDGLFWKTKVECSSDPNRVGGFEVRRIQFLEDGERKFMVLRPKQDLITEVWLGVAVAMSSTLTMSLGWEEDQGGVEVGEVRIDLLLEWMVQSSDRGLKTIDISILLGLHIYIGVLLFNVVALVVRRTSFLVLRQA